MVAELSRMVDASSVSGTYSLLESASSDELKRLYAELVLVGLGDCLFSASPFRTAGQSEELTEIAKELGFGPSPFDGLWESDNGFGGKLYYYLTGIGDRGAGVVAEKSRRFGRLKVKRMRYAGSTEDSAVFQFEEDRDRVTLTFSRKNGGLKLATKSGFGNHAPVSLVRVGANEARKLVSQIREALD